MVTLKTKGVKLYENCKRIRVLLRYQVEYFKVKVEKLVRFSEALTKQYPKGWII